MIKTKTILLFLLGLAIFTLVAEDFNIENSSNGFGRQRIMFARSPDDFANSMECFPDTGKVDIVFCMDTSHSMEPYLADLRENMNEFIDSVVALGFDYRLGAVPFDDSTNVWDFDAGASGYQMTSDTAEFNSWLDDVDVSEIASDSWEVSLDAIFDAITLYDWREEALQIIVMFTNEGYHSTDDDTNLSDVSFEEVRDTVLSSGAVVFIAASSRPWWVGSPIPEEHMENFINLADTSGGYLDSLTNDWTYILDFVVDLVATFTTVNVSIQNLTGSSTVIGASLEQLAPSCLPLHSENPQYSDGSVPNSGWADFTWKVIVDTSCTDIDACFDLRVWGSSVADTFYGCVTDDICYGYTDASFEHTPPTLTTTCREINPNPANLHVDVYNDGIRPLTDVDITFSTSSSFLSISGGDSNPRHFEDIGYLSSEAVNWQLSIHPAGVGGTYTYEVKLEYAEGDSIVQEYEITVPEFISPPEANITRGDSIICPGEWMEIDASVSPSGSWEYSWTPHAGLDDPSSLTPEANPETTTTYSLLVSDGYDCIDRDRITIVVTDTVFADAGDDTTIFPGRNLIIGGDPSGWGGYGSLEYTWTPTEGLSNPTAPNPSISPYSSQEYVLTVTDAEGCQALDTIQIDVKDPLGYIFVQDETEILELRVIDTLDAIRSDNGVIMVQMPGGVTGAADLVDTTDTWASPVLIQTTRGIRAWRHKIYTP